MCAECSTPLPRFRVFYDKSTFFSRKDVRRISIRSSASSALGAARATMTLTCSNIQRKIRALGLIPSNLQVNYHNYHQGYYQNDLRSEQVLPSKVDICPEG